MEKLSIHADKVQFHSAGRPVPPVGAKNLSPYVRCRPMLLTGGSGRPAMKLAIYIRSKPASLVKSRFQAVFCKVVKTDSLVKSWLQTTLKKAKIKACAIFEELSHAKA